MPVGGSFQSYNLVLSEDRLSSQYRQTPELARKLINFIPSRAGDLKRKRYSPPFTTVDPTIGGNSAWYSFAQDMLFYVGGSPTRQFILAVSNNSGTFLYKFASGGGIEQLPAGAYSPPHNESAGVPNGWVGDPLLLYSDGLLFISDGQANGNGTVYDGTDSWKWGLDIPNAPTVNVGGTSSPGSISIEIFAEYAITEYDSVRKQESPPSARSRFTPVTPDTYDVQLDLPAKKNVAPGTTASDWTAGYPDKWRIYRSHIDGSTRMFRIAEIDIASTQFIDTVPMWGDSATTSMKPLEPPYRNHKPKPSLVGAKMHNRFALRDEGRRSRIWVTGFAEVKEQDPTAVNPLETVPGARNEDITAIADRSDFLNFVELPDESAEVRALLWWDEGLMVGTERAVTFVWGSRPEEFRPENTSTYAFGVFHKNSFLLTTHGLAIFTSDRKLMLDPAATAGGGDRTARVIDIGWPLQKELDKSDIRFTNRFQMRHFQFGSERDWLVVAWTNQNAIDGGKTNLAVFDFEMKGWFTFDDIGATCAGLIQEDEGYTFLVAGDNSAAGAERKLRVVTDFDSSGSSAYQAAATRVGLPAAGTETVPANTYKTPLLDLQGPDLWKIWRYLAFFKSAAFTVVVNAWYDPVDVDNLGAADQTLVFNQLNSNEHRSFLWKTSKRAVFEFTIAADSNNGALQGIEINVSPKTNIFR